MDVTCERCGTEYEFDETLLSGRGTSVKCTNCGHVFKVYPKAREQADRTTSHWRLRTGDGTIETIESLRDLQRRILNGELSLTDEIARGDQTWKPLGSIPELETFFRAAAPSSASTDQEAEQRPDLEGIVADPFAGHSPRAPGSDRPVRNKTLLGVVPLPGQPPYATASETAGFRQPSMPPRDSRAAAGQAGQPEPEPPALSEAGPEVPRSAARGTRIGYMPPGQRGIEDADYEERSSPHAPTSAPLPYYDDEDLPSLPSRTWTWRRWLGIGLLLLLASVIALRWEQIGAWVGLLPDPATVEQAMDAGDAAMREDHLAAYERAITSYRLVADTPRSDSAVDVRLARAYALAADSLAGPGAERQDPVRAQQYARRALEYANAALTAEPDDLGAAIARADALRLLGMLQESEDQLAAAQKMPFFRTAEYFRVRALLQAAKAEGKLSAGYKNAERAQEAEPDGIRYRLLRARANMDADETAEAQAQLEAVLRAQPLHPVATSLLKDLQAQQAAADETQDRILAEDATEASASADAEEADELPGPDSGPAEEARAEEPPKKQTARPRREEEARAKEPPKKQAERSRREVVKSQEPGELAPKEDSAPAPTEAKPDPEETQAAAPARKASPAQPRSDLAYDEYDEPTDESINGLPPARDYNWHMRQARTYLARGDYNGARAQFERALEERPGSPEPTDGLGEVAMAAGDPALALRYFRSAAQRGHQDAFFKLGNAYERLGRNEQALSAYYTYLETHPSGRYAPTAKAAIRRLESDSSAP